MVPLARIGLKTMMILSFLVGKLKYLEKSRKLNHFVFYFDKILVCLNQL